MSRARTLTETAACGHTTSGNGFTFSCDRAAGHKGWHRETRQLRDGPSRTEWGDDGLAVHASRDDKRRRNA